MKESAKIASRVSASPAGLQLRHARSPVILLWGLGISRFHADAPTNLPSGPSKAEVHIMCTFPKILPHLYLSVTWPHRALDSVRVFTSSTETRTPVLFTNRGSVISVVSDMAGWR